MDEKIYQRTCEQNTRLFCKLSNGSGNFSKLPKSLTGGKNV